ncbi:MAG: fibronectin type III domain-containing protein [Chloroflexota bacterium]|nr:fibronectin type III domain-containing protein [Chloroflexota bacterium]MDE2821403.1 fibronectin type III domain-containing protein [Chloroflexota bacterium]
MKIRSRIKIIGLALALCVVFAALPLQAQSISNLTYDGTSAESNTMALSWNTVANTDSVKLQVKGGGIVDSWMSVDGLSISVDGGRTIANFQDLSTWQVSGTIYNFRVKVELQDGSSTPWAYVDQS